MKIDISRFTGKFREETHENLANFDATLIKFERNLEKGGEVFDASARELIRITHAIKGGSRMLGFKGINQLCHALEEFLISARNRSSADSGVVDLIIAARRCIERMLSLPPSAEDANGEQFEWLKSLLDRLKAASETGEIVGQDQVLENAYISDNEEDKDVITEEKEKQRIWRSSTVRVDVDAIDDLVFFGRELGLALDGLRRTQREIGVICKKLDERVNNFHTAYSNIDTLINEDIKIEKELNRLTLTLRERISEVDQQMRLIDSGAVELRMRPIEELYETLPLQVRDLAASLGREVDLALSGGEVRLDGRIIEMLGEPLIHIIRNSMDHGLEPPEEREANRKPRRGKIAISASENAGWARISIMDDGRGIDAKKIWKRAAELGLTSSKEPPAGKLKEGFQFLFNDRFSSKDKATDISGRGMGLAAVKLRIHELRGDVTIESEVSMGTRFVLNIPTSLSSQRALVTSVDLCNGGRLFVGFPTAMVIGTSTRSPAENDSRQKPPVRNPDETTLSLSRIMGGMQDGPPLPSERYIINVDDGLRNASIAVSQIISETETVIEPLPAIAGKTSLIAGAAPITPHQIMLILNVPAVLARFTLRKN